MAKKIAFVFLIVVALTVTLVLALKQYLKTPLPPGGDFTLESVTGPKSLKSFHGKGVVLYFGYTSCPDACPTSLSHLSQVFQKLSVSERAQVVPIFISVDSRTDTPKKVDDYIKFYFKTTGVGLTGTKSQIDQVVKQYGTSYRFVDDKSSALGYSVQHGTDFYFIDSSGELEAIAPTMASDQELLRDLKYVADE